MTLPVPLQCIVCHVAKSRATISFCHPSLLVFVLERHGALAEDETTKQNVFGITINAVIPWNQWRDRLERDFKLHGAASAIDSQLCVRAFWLLCDHRIRRDENFLTRCLERDLAFIRH